MTDEIKNCCKPKMDETNAAPESKTVEVRKPQAPKVDSDDMAKSGGSCCCSP